MKLFNKIKILKNRILNKYPFQLIRNKYLLLTHDYKKAFFSWYYNEDQTLKYISEYYIDYLNGKYYQINPCTKKVLENYLISNNIDLTLLNSLKDTKLHTYNSIKKILPKTLHQHINYFNINNIDFYGKYCNYVFNDIFKINGYNPSSYKYIFNKIFLTNHFYEKIECKIVKDVDNDIEYLTGNIQPSFERNNQINYEYFNTIKQIKNQDKINKFLIFLTILMPIIQIYGAEIKNFISYFLEYIQ